MQIDVIDDASPNGASTEFIRKLAGKRVTVHCEPRNLALAEIWNRCAGRMGSHPPPGRSCIPGLLPVVAIWCRKISAGRRSLVPPRLLRWERPLASAVQFGNAFARIAAKLCRAAGDSRARPVRGC